MPPTPLANVEGVAAPPARARFGWPMRIFLTFIVFDMVFHSLAVLTPHKDWCKDLGMKEFPEPLPTVEEMRELADKTNEDGPDPVADRVLDSFDSLWEYFKPWPSSRTRKKIRSLDDAGKYTLCWLTTRLGFMEQLVRFEQRWTMFSPNVGKYDTAVRAKLVYADGSARFHRTEADPEDLTNYSHWFKEKVLEYSTKLANDSDARLGYCNLLAHRYPKNEHGSPLVRIYLIKVRINYPPPDEEDIAGFMRRQNGPPGWEQKKPFYEYDPTNPNKNRRGKRLGGSASSI
jgi:hypothetical protein